MASNDPLVKSGFYNQDPSKVFSSVGGKNYDFAGREIKPSANETASSEAQRRLDQALQSLAATQAQLAAQPKLAKFDVAGSYTRAGQTAASTVNPVYTDKLNQYLQQSQAKIRQNTVETDVKKADIQSALQQALEDNSITRGRTTEDVTNKLGDIENTEDTFQRQEGRQFDRARTALLGNVANSGLTESGIGQGAVADAVTDRNIASDAQTTEFNNQRRDTELFKTRTLADLDKSDTRQTGGATRQTESQDRALRDYIENAGLEEQGFRAENELNRVTAVSQATTSAYQQLVAQAVAALAGSGARAQDIALFKQVYG